MKDYFNELLKVHDYYIEILNYPPPNKIKDYENFLMMNFYDFRILVQYQFHDIDYNTINNKSIYQPNTFILS